MLINQERLQIHSKSVYIIMLGVRLITSDSKALSADVSVHCYLLMELVSTLFVAQSHNSAKGD